jgi:hypothetical protein
MGVMMTQATNSQMNLVSCYIDIAQDDNIGRAAEWFEWTRTLRDIHNLPETDTGS